MNVLDDALLGARTKRALPAILWLLLVAAAAAYTGYEASGVMAKDPVAPTLMPVIALLSIYVSVSEKGLLALKEWLEYIRTGSEAPEHPSLVTPLVRFGAIAFFLSCSSALYAQYGTSQCDDDVREHVTNEGLWCRLVDLEGQVAHLAQRNESLRKHIGDVTAKLQLDNFAAFPLIHGNARHDEGKVLEESNGISAESAVNVDRLHTLAKTVALLVQSRRRPGCESKGRLRVSVRGFASDARFIGLPNSDDLNLQAANLRAKSAAKKLSDMLELVGVPEFAQVVPHRWRTLQSMREARPAFQENDANLEESDRWLIGRSVFYHVEEPPDCFPTHIVEEQGG